MSLSSRFATRIGEGLFAVWGAGTLVFIATRLLGDPSSLLVPPGASRADIELIQHSLGLDQSLWLQYSQFLLDACLGHFGNSFQSGRPAMQVVVDALPATLLLTCAGMVLGLIFGGIAGTVAALKRGTVWETVALGWILLGQATPAFWLGLIAIMVFAVQLGWLPTGGYGHLRYLVLPALVLSVYTGATIAKLLRSSILEIINEDYIRTARAKGLLPSTVLAWHILRNAVVPVMTMTALMTGELLGGSVVIETVYSWPGVGRVIVQAIGARDFPVIQAGVMLIAFMFVVVSLSADALHGYLDPRSRLQGVAQ